jgi:steroid delta-isomerase-like uncharacterized protein
MPGDAKALLRHFYAEVSAGNLGVIDELVSDDMVEHEETPGVPPTKDGVKQFFAGFRGAFPDLTMEPHEMVAEGDLVTARITIAGTNEGDFMGMLATGKHVEIQAIDMIRVREGRFVEHWGITDALRMMEQLGALPAPA